MIQTRNCNYTSWWSRATKESAKSGHLSNEISGSFIPTTSFTSNSTYLLASGNFSIIITDTILYNFSKQFPVRINLFYSPQSILRLCDIFLSYFYLSKRMFFTSYTMLYPLNLPHSTTVSAYNLIRCVLYFAAVNVHKSMVVSFK